jgi:hypothetical protein
VCPPRAREEPNLPELPIQYLDYAHWRANSGGQALQTELEFWKQPARRRIGNPDCRRLPRTGLKVAKGAVRRPLN